MSGQHEQAVEWAQKAIREQPRWTGSYRALASSLAHLGQTEAARSALGQLMEIDPTFSLDFIRRFYLPSSGREVFVSGLRLAGAAEGHPGAPEGPVTVARGAQTIFGTGGDGRLSIGRLGSGHLDQEAAHEICRDAHIAC
jgi:tetratricopeptide (TPR) repeat protein